MAVITKAEILDRIKKGEIGFEPMVDIFQLQRHAVDLRLGYIFSLPQIWRLSVRGREALNIDYTRKIDARLFETIELKAGQYFELLPQEYVLVSVLEKVKLPADLMAVMYPRSSTNRKGLSVDLTGIIDAGYEGSLTIPIRNNTTSQVIRLYPGERICQLVFEELSAKITEGRKSKYHKQKTSIYLPDKEEEIKLISAGKIETLKKRYPIK